jgi:histone deacetylase 6
MESSSKSTDGMDVDKDVSMEQKDGQRAVSSIVQKPRASSVPIKYPDFSVGYVYSSEMMSHFSPQGHHPEQPQRIQRIWVALKSGQLTEKMKWIPIREVRRDETLLVHSEDHWNKVIALQCEFA